MQHREESAEVTLGLCRHSYIEGRLVLSPICEYPTCTKSTLNGVVITCVSGQDLKHRSYCCELHAAFALLEVARNEVVGCYTEANPNEKILQLAARSSAGELVTTTRQDDIDREVDRILSS
jgi:hypothetical protein